MPKWSEEGYQRILEAANRGRQTFIEVARAEYEKKIETYNKNPTLCKCCLTPLSFKKYTNKSIYCSKSCAAKVNNRNRTPKGITRQCCNCQKEFITSKNSTGKFCSSLCSSTYKKKKTMKEWLDGEHTPSAGTLRQYLKELKPAECENCKLSHWNGMPIPLEMDHKDGNHKNNQLNNLQLLCPNCHAQTPTYKSKNKGKGRDYRRERWRVGKTC
jgi:hypothetical protein